MEGIYSPPLEPVLNSIGEGARGDLNHSHFFQVVHAGFSHPRKQLLGNLSKELKIAKEKVELALIAAGIKNSQRAETLTVEDWIELTKFLSAKI